MSKDDFQNNVKFLLTDEVKNNLRTYKIVDGTQALKTAYIFYKGTVKNNVNEQIMATEMRKNYCDWWAKNRNIVEKYFLNK
ncbi:MULTISPECIES: hypothetical protein [Tenacibaculum]|uniref:hypothetical protein n=1 Tax=Tenacibaculum TaxID=104267 RepID=UPI00187B74AF|nr:MULTISPECIES: hypothetical protein [Tenacibaculum]MBE7671645.1 hypothetical protein [Tenacibaculum piscium]MBE7686586.1 hypothetical protein [Tenacibaculum piscium]MCG8729631.1 hypothetical protein [Tenacibaculum finnmarkense]MCG8747996.1 hypothetical protein [Tenacibaculum finnmarkense]MCG8760859.1 hypothetical protein [Tenacibaculum finnmarkense]